MLIEIHILQNHVPSNINRDDLGAPKTCLFGGVPRARISSQCLKRSIRQSSEFAQETQDALFEFLKSPSTATHQPKLGTRTKQLADLISRALGGSEIEKAGEHQKVARAVALRIAPASEKSQTKVGNPGDKEKHKTPQLIFVSPFEIVEIAERLKREWAKRDAKEEKLNWDYLMNPASSFAEILKAEIADDAEFQEEFGEQKQKNSYFIYFKAMKALQEKQKAQEKSAGDAKVGSKGKMQHSQQWSDPTESEPGEVETFYDTDSPVKDGEFLTASDAKKFIGWVRNNFDSPLLKTASKISKDEKKDFAPDKPGGDNDFFKRIVGFSLFNPVDISLFGRMTTSDAFENVEASMEVAHAISTHEVSSAEVDYFTAVDDLGATEHIGETQFNSACYYKHFSLDWKEFVKNLRGREPELKDFNGDAKKHAEGNRAWESAKSDKEKLAETAIAAFIRAAAMSTPSGKRNSFAHCNLPHAVYVEVKKQKIQTNFANAFAHPATKGEDGLEEDSVKRFVDYVKKVHTAYDIKPEVAAWLTLGDHAAPCGTRVDSISKLIKEVLDGVRKF